MEKKISRPTKQSNISIWAEEKLDKQLQFPNKQDSKKINKPRLTFGYGYNPEILRNGIKNFTYSHSLDNNLKLYEYEPKISYRIFSTLSEILKYNYLGSELRKGKTIIKSSYFITDEEPEKIFSEINSGIKKIFEIYEPEPT